MEVTLLSSDAVRECCEVIVVCRRGRAAGSTVVRSCFKGTGTLLWLTQTLESDEHLHRSARSKEACAVQTEGGFWNTSDSTGERGGVVVVVVLMEASERKARPETNEDGEGRQRKERQTVRKMQWKLLQVSPRLCFLRRATGGGPGWARLRLRWSSLYCTV
jgi:hypothetical protein